MPATRRTVGELMSAPPVTVSPDDDLAVAAARMQAHGVGSVVVVDEGGQAVGILTERDLVRVVASGSAAAGTVASWMTPEPDVVAPGLDAGEAFASLSAHGYRHIPVVEGSAVTGVVSMRDLLRIAQVQPVEHPSTIDAPPGLAGVLVADTRVGDVRGEQGFYHYRQYDAVALAEKRSLEDVWHLLFDGTLPTAAQRSAFVEEIRAARALPPAVLEVLPSIARSSADVMEAVRTAVSLLGAVEGFRPTLDLTPAERRRDALRVCAAIPTLIMTIHRLRSGQAPIEPHPSLGYGANYLWMLTGTEPSPEVARAVEQYQITTIDHGFNASTFAARVITSSGADVAAAVVGGIGALSGPLHGGAPSRALDLLDEIGSVDRAREVLVGMVERGEKIMGFGHRVYRTEDPRAVFMRSVAERAGAAKVEMARAVEATVVEVLAELKPGRQLYANVEFYAGVVMDHCGLPPSLFTPTFASSRVIGWCANILEQAADNRIIRPGARYVGPPPPQPVPDPED